MPELKSDLFGPFTTFATTPSASLSHSNLDGGRGLAVSEGVSSSVSDLIVMLPEGMMITPDSGPLPYVCVKLARVDSPVLELGVCAEVAECAVVGLARVSSVRGVPLDVVGVAGGLTLALPHSSQSSLRRFLFSLSGGRVSFCEVTQKRTMPLIVTSAAQLVKQIHPSSRPCRKVRTAILTYETRDDVSRLTTRKVLRPTQDVASATPDDAKLRRATSRRRGEIPLCKG